MKPIVRMYLFLSRKPVTVISMCAAAIITLALWKIEADIDPSGGGIIGLQLAFTVEQARTILSSWRDGGAARFLGTVWLNYLNAVSLSVLLASAPGFFARERSGFNPGAVPPRDALFCLAPFAACLCDWAVLTMMVLLISGGYSDVSLIRSCAVTAVVKWIILAFCLAILLRSYFATRKEKRRNQS